MFKLTKLLGSSKKKTIKSTNSSRTKKNSLNLRKKKVNKSHLKKYRTRPSPNTSATSYKVGTVKVGNDGKKYVVISTKGKKKRTKRWVRQSKNNKNTRRNNNKNMRGGSCSVSLGKESGFKVLDTHVHGGSSISGLNLGSSRFEISRSCNSSKTGHAMI